MASSRLKTTCACPPKHFQDGSFCVLWQCQHQCPPNRMPGPRRFTFLPMFVGILGAARQDLRCRASLSTETHLFFPVNCHRLTYSYFYFNLFWKGNSTELRKIDWNWEDHVHSPAKCLLATSCEPSSHWTLQRWETEIVVILRVESSSCNTACSNLVLDRGRRTQTHRQGISLL